MSRADYSPAPARVLTIVIAYLTGRELGMGTMADASNDSVVAEGNSSSGGLDRRQLIQRAAVAGAVAWTAPVVLDSLASPAAAASQCAAGITPSTNPITVPYLSGGYKGTGKTTNPYSFTTGAGIKQITIAAWGGGGKGGNGGKGKGGAGGTGGGGGGGGAYQGFVIASAKECTTYLFDITEMKDGSDVTVQYSDNGGKSYTLLGTANAGTNGGNGVDGGPGVGPAGKAGAAGSSGVTFAGGNGAAGGANATTTGGVGGGGGGGAGGAAVGSAASGTAHGTGGTGAGPFTDGGSGGDGSDGASPGGAGANDGPGASDGKFPGGGAGGGGGGGATGKGGNGGTGGFGSVVIFTT
jgi:hypothetical protein